jgi:hypothetical protein
MRSTSEAQSCRPADCRRRVLLYARTVRVPPVAERLLELAPAALVEYRPLLQSWVVVARDLQPDAEGRVLVTLPRPGPFALVTADLQEPAIVTPAIGDALTGVPAVLLPFTTTSRGEVSPAVLPPTGGTAEGRLLVEAPTALPSGTLVQAEVT